MAACRYQLIVDCSVDEIYSSSKCMSRFVVFTSSLTFPMVHFFNFYYFPFKQFSTSKLVIKSDDMNLTQSCRTCVTTTHPGVEHAQSHLAFLLFCTEIPVLITGFENDDWWSREK